MATLPRRVKPLSAASPLWPLLMAQAMGSLALGGYSDCWFLLLALALRPPRLN